LYRNDISSSIKRVRRYIFFLLSEGPKVDKVENEVQRSDAEAEKACGRIKMPCFLHHRCIQLSASINVTQRLRLQPQTSPDLKFIVFLLTASTLTTKRLKSPPVILRAK
jgi:hypothetical protein